MKAKIFRILGVIGLILAAGSLSACVDEQYYPAHPGYSYNSPAYAYPEYYPVPRYAPPRAYAYNPHPYWQYRNRWEHEEHEEYERHEGHHHRHHHDHDRGDHDRDWF